MSDKIQLRLLAANFLVKELVSELNAIEKDTTSSIDDKLLKIKKIREEMAKVSEEIDNIKKEIKITKTYDIN